jgi:hypothetical protein
MKNTEQQNKANTVIELKNLFEQISIVNAKIRIKENRLQKKLYLLEN